MCDSSGGLSDELNENGNSFTNGAQSLDLQNFLKSRENEIKCKSCKKRFTSSEELKIHVSNHDKLKEKINTRKSKRIRNCNQKIFSQNESCLKPLNDLEEFLKLVNSEKEKDEQHKDNLDESRVSCNVCGFIAKNSRGLKIHTNVHNKSISPNKAQPKKMSVKFQVDLQLFGVLLNECKISIPIVRIIQKSVRSIISQELTNVIRDVVNKNDVLAWMRLFCISVHSSKLFEKRKKWPKYDPYQFETIFRIGRYQHGIDESSEKSTFESKKKVEDF